MFMTAIVRSKIFHILLGFSVSAVIIGWLIYSLNWQEVATKLVGINYWALLPLILISFIHFFLRAYRWRYLLPVTQDNPTIINLFGSMMVGNLATFILPLRAGEFVRPYMLTMFSRHSFSIGLASVVIERFLDLSMVLISFAITVSFVPELPTWVYQSSVALGILAVLLLLFIVAGAIFQNLVMHIVDRMLKIIPQSLRKFARSFISDLLAGTKVISNPINLARVVLLTIVIWTTCFASFYITFSFFSMQYSWLLSVTLGVIVALAVAAPSAPGFLGAYQLGCIVSFALFGLGREEAVAYSIVSHLFQYAFIITVAGVFLVTRNIKLSQVIRKE
jgi:glycosyltransferase 2 family protein